MASEALRALARRYGSGRPEPLEPVTPEPRVP